MSIAKVDDKMKKVFFLEDSRLNPIIEDIIKSCTDKNESIQLQLNIKGYENRKDPKLTKDILFPYIMRRDPYVCIIGNASVQPFAEELKVPFALVSEYEGKTLQEKKR